MKLLVLVLTSSKIKLLKRCVESVKNQYKVNLNYDVKIIVNTKNNDYYNEVITTIKDIEIIRTESNSRPGKGHNSCFKVFKQKSEYTHCSMIDGDDMYYPVAFQQFERMLNKNPELDLVHLMLNDRVHFDNPDNFNYKNLKFNFKLISSFRENENWWNKVVLKSPLENKIEDCKTPSRILLVSRNIFNTTLPIEYSEDLTLYDDFIVFCAFYEAQLKNELNTFSTSDTNIYLYNCLNDHSASHNFKKKEQENIMFQKESSVFTNVLKDNWKINNLPFMQLEQPNNFTTEDKINFCNDKVINFEISNIFEELSKVKVLSKDNTKELDRIERYFLILIRSGFDSPNNLLKMIEIRFLKNDVNTALLKLIDLSKLNPTLDIYTKIFNLLYKYKVYERCEYYYELIKIYDGITKDITEKWNVILSNKYQIGNNNVYKNGKLQLNLDPTKETFCYFTGYTDSFNGKNYGEKNVYGSEIAAVKLGENMTKYYNVIILCSNETITYHNGVHYVNSNLFQDLISNYKINHFVISRFIGCLLDMNLTNIGNVYYIMHDARVHDLWHNKHIPLLSIYLFKNFISKLTKIICVSNWQKENFNNMLGLAEIKIPDEKYCILNNGINTNKFKYNKINKIQNRFISCSDPTRGLDMTCEILVELQKKYNNITLDIYFGSLPNDIRNKYVNQYDFIKYHGKISNEQMIEEFSKNDFWLYPNINSHETFCISCLEAMCGGNVVITRDFSALPELVKNNGILIPENLQGNDLKKFVIEKINNIMNDNDLKNKYQYDAHFNSLQYDWSNIAENWYSILNNAEII